MPTVSIRKDDEVEVISGKDRGARGRVVRVLPREGRVMVEGIARAKKHTRAGSRRSTSGQRLQQGGIIDMEQFVDISNVLVVCRTCGQPTRIGHRMEGTKKVRMCRKCEGDL